MGRVAILLSGALEVALFASLLRERALFFEQGLECCPISVCGVLPIEPIFRILGGYWVGAGAYGW